MVPRPYIGCSGFWPLWVVNATRVTPLPSNGTLMGSNGLTVWLGNCLGCLFILNDYVPPSGVVNPFTCQRTIVKVTSSGTSVCSSVLSLPKHEQDIFRIQLSRFSVNIIISWKTRIFSTRKSCLTTWKTISPSSFFFFHLKNIKEKFSFFHKSRTTIDIWD